jgi:hypothetical protein
MAGLRFKERRGEEDIHIFLDRNQTSPIATARSAHVKLLHDMKDLFDYLAWRVERSTGRVGVQFNTVSYLFIYLFVYLYLLRLEGLSCDTMDLIESWLRGRIKWVIVELDLV